MRSQLFAPEMMEQPAQELFTLQNPHLLKVALNGELMARQGSMIAYQGQMEFEHQGAGGIGKLIKRAVTGEGAPLMKVTGQGTLFLARDANSIHLVRLEDEALTVNGESLLAFEPGITWDIHKVEGAGMLAGGVFNTLLQGTGWVAVTSFGTPVVLQIDQPTYVDSQSAIAWSQGVTTRLHTQFKMGSLIGRSSGESTQLEMSGQGFVVVQASEAPVVPEHEHPHDHS